MPRTTLCGTSDSTRSTSSISASAAQRAGGRSFRRAVHGTCRTQEPGTHPAHWLQHCLRKTAGLGAAYHRHRVRTSTTLSSRPTTILSRAPIHLLLCMKKSWPGRTTRSTIEDCDGLRTILERPHPQFQRALIPHSVSLFSQRVLILCFSLFRESSQVGFARLITDHVTYAYLCDVYVLEDLRGLGLGSWLIRCMLDHPDIRSIRRVSLITHDAQDFYLDLGFEFPPHPDRYLELLLVSANP